MYEKKLKRGKDGLFTRYVGQNGRGVPEKFRLGYDQEGAEEKGRLIAALWTETEGLTPPGYKASWDRASLEAAKGIAKGKPPALPKRDYEDPIKYVQRVAAISQSTGAVFQPGDPFNHQAGLDDLREEAVNARKKFSDALGVPAATGTSFRQATEAYEGYIRRSLTLPNGDLRPWVAPSSTKSTPSRITSPMSDLEGETTCPSTWPICRTTDATRCMGSSDGDP